ncbi:FKBP-type peptidyl-prolyl cis-trans isomerase N-terminal domain-containing protein [Aquimonas voraii]|uniref:Peptidyl-prolyl cis-trans isomerase n=1 Tax=Aquimonas voraii TaxID=265719 RepID=A0A1G6UKN4_9GAMM|nr:FKBP-type peptidyl-prolyl cis-trans isomerase [Aquimonas voraii]SDD41839.1 peptidylprolyl isomerase [Aquimonas voraii]
MKLRWLVVSVAVFGMGAVQAQDTSSEKGKLSYAIGYQLGREMAERGVDLDVATVVRGVQEGFAKRDPSVPPEEMRAAVEKMQAQMLEQARAEFERVAAENKAKSEQFLSQNRAKQGIQNLASGIQYRVIEQGTGAQPTAASEVQIHFRGSLSTGQEFASTYTGNEPVTMKVSEAPLPGLREVLPMMKVGSRWEVFLPPDQGYGDNPRSPVGPGQAVVFDVKLVSIK